VKSEIVRSDIRTCGAQGGHHKNFWKPTNFKSQPAIKKKVLLCPLYLTATNWPATLFFFLRISTFIFGVHSALSIPL
jgi:hypothetical protein